MTRTITTDDELAALLGELGSTPDGVADRLRAAGIKGQRGKAWCCPIANWLVRETGLTNPEVHFGSVAADCELPSGNLSCVGVDMPPQIYQFIRRFDDGVYLDLVEEVTSGG